MNLSKKVGTIIGAGTIVDGNITCDGDVAHIDGTINGDIYCTGAVVVGKEGEVNGNITTASLSLAGVLNGNVKAAEKVEILSRAKLYGDVETSGIAIEDSAVFMGRCIMEEPVEEKNDVDAKQQAENPSETE